MIAVLVIGGVVLLAMIGVSIYGWVTLPADARVPVHFGAGYNNFRSKNLGLVIHPVAAAVVYVISVVTTHNPGKAAAAAYIFPVIMCVLLIVQVGAIKVARSRSGAMS
jgi:hypothetical protein